MSTVDRAFAENIAAHAGYYNGDSENSLGDNPRCVLITEYDNAWGGVGYGLTLDGKANRYVESEFVRNPRVFWQWDGA